MTAQNHIIKKQVLDFTLDFQAGSFAFQSRAGEFFKTEILSIIDDYCTRICNDSGIIRIDKLEIDLGVINKKTFEADFKNKFKALFYEKILKVSGISQDEYPSHISASQVGITEEIRDFEVLEFFLKEGRLPWWVKSGELYDISALLELNVTRRPTKLKNLIAVNSGNHSLLKRLIYHTGDAGLEKIIGFFWPERYQEICKLSQNLIKVITGCPLLKTCGPSKIGPEVWTGILSLTAGSAGQVVNRRLIVQASLRQISMIFGVDYEALYSYVTKKIKVTGDDVTGKPLLSGIIEMDSKTKEYLQQLITLENSLKELFFTLSDHKAAPEFSVAAQQLLKGLADRLPHDIQLIQNIVKMIDKLLQKTGKTDVFLLTPAEMDQGLPKQAAEFEESIKKLRFDLTVVLEKSLEANNEATNKAEIDERLKKQAAEFEKSNKEVQFALAAVLDEKLTSNHEVAKKIIKAMESIDELSEKTLPPEGLPATDAFTDSDEIYVLNAGIVLLWPYLANLFKTLDLVEENRFVDEEAKERAVLILQYLACGTEAASEYELALNKILCGIAPGAPLRPCFEIAEKEVIECENLLQAVILNWPALKNLSVPGLRSMFLMREGMIFTRDGHWVLRTAEQACDILLDKMPWGISTVKLPWMEELLFVEWRL